MNFPELRNGQHAVLAAELETGIVLSLDGKIWLRDKPAKCWRVFDSFEEARQFAIAEVSKNPSVEFWIYASKDHPLERIWRKTALEKSTEDIQPKDKQSVSWLTSTQRSRQIAWIAPCCLLFHGHIWCFTTLQAEVNLFNFITLPYLFALL